MIPSNTNRRQFLKASATVGLTFFYSSCSGKTRPNIIYIIADDLGYGDLGCYGQKNIKTPNIDRMAAEGIKCTQHYAGSSVCAPSRCVLMTGLHTGHAYVRGNQESEPYGQLPLPEKTATVASLLQSAGYRTGIFGKWGLGVQNNTGNPQNHGFDEFYGYYCQVHAHNSFPEYLYHNGQKVMLQNRVIYMPKDHWTRGLGSYAAEKVEYSNDLIFNACLDFIKNNSRNPFFAYLPVTIPHNNGEAPDGEKYEAPSMEPYAGENWNDDNKRYAAMITRLDGYVGTLIQRLKELDLDDRTVIFFTSDNGGVANPLFRSNGALRGYKQDLYEGGIRVPMIVRWPGKIKANTITDHVSAFWDFLPTACDLAGIQKPENIDGLSYLPALMGESQEQHEYLYWEFYWWKPPYMAVRMGDWKGLYFFNAEGPGRFELYDLGAYPTESEECGARHPEVVNRIKEIMQQAHAQSAHFPTAEMK
ncbi:arylsulfatase [candidate division KSB1 bacterium]|nr:arylsulfatase [candidate division KSB1 bacterium]